MDGSSGICKRGSGDMLENAKLVPTSEYEPSNLGCGDILLKCEDKLKFPLFDLDGPGTGDKVLNVSDSGKA